MKGIGILRGTPFESQTTGPETTNLSLVDKTVAIGGGLMWVDCLPQSFLGNFFQVDF